MLQFISKGGFVLNGLNLPPDIWGPFAQHRASVNCSAGYLIYLQNTHATCFYYLKEGIVKSYFQSEDGSERVLHIYRAGSLFGEASFFDELPRVSSAVALTPCQIVPIDRELVVQEVSKHPELALAMLKYLSRTVRLLSDQLDGMAFRPVWWRLAAHLLSNANPTIHCTHEELAASISANRVTVTRTLKELAQQGLIALGYRSITILDRPALEQLCHTEQNT